jgi:hypothetical protein
MGGEARGDHDQERMGGQARGDHDQERFGGFRPGPESPYPFALPLDWLEAARRAGASPDSCGRPKSSCSVD